MTIYIISYTFTRKSMIMTKMIHTNDKNQNHYSLIITRMNTVMTNTYDENEDHEVYANFVDESLY